MRIIEQCLRVYAPAAALENTIGFYERLQGVTCARRVHIAETDVTAARVGSVLILAGDSDAMIEARMVHGIFYVDDLDAFAALVEEEGGVFVHPPRIVTGGRNFTARHADGLIMEYFEARR